MIGIYLFLFIISAATGCGKFFLDGLYTNGIITREK